VRGTGSASISHHDRLKWEDYGKLTFLGVFLRRIVRISIDVEDAQRLPVGVVISFALWTCQRYHKVANSKGRSSIRGR
jgi:hypothetical protein